MRGSLCARCVGGRRREQGAFVPDGSRLEPQTPVRLADTRTSGRAEVLRLDVPLGEQPDATGAVLNLTATGSRRPGFVTAFPCVTPVPGTSSLTFPAETAVGSLTVSTLGSGSLCVFSNVRTHLIVDVLGVWTGAPTTPITPPGSPDDGDDVAPDAGTAVVDAGPRPSDAGAPSVDVGVSATDAGEADATADAVGDDVVTDEMVLTGGCGCRAGGARPPGASLSLGAMLAVASLARRRRLRAAISARSSLPR